MARIEQHINMHGDIDDVTLTCIASSLSDLRERDVAVFMRMNEWESHIYCRFIVAYITIRQNKDSIKKSIRDY